MPIPAGSTTAIVTLADAHAELNMGSDTSQDTELQGFLDAITQVVENITGPIIEVSFTEWHDGGTNEIILGRYPVVGVPAVVEYANSVATTLAGEPLDTTATFTSDGFQWDPDTGILIRTDGGTPKAFPFGTRNVSVTYTAGRASVPPNVRMAALELIRLHWKPQRSGGPSTLGSDVRGDDDWTGATILGFYVPGKVLELLAPHRKAPFVA